MRTVALAFAAAFALAAPALAAPSAPKPDTRLVSQPPPCTTAARSQGSSQGSSSGHDAAHDTYLEQGRFKVDFAPATRRTGPRCPPKPTLSVKPHP